MSQKDNLIAIRDIFQSLLDNYLIGETAMTGYKSALVQLNAAIDTPPEVAPPVVQAVTSTADVVAGVLAGISTDTVVAGVLAGLATPLTAMSAAIGALTPMAPTPAVLPPTADQIAAAQAVMAAANATAAAGIPA